MISGHGNIETAVSAIKRGAYDFIEKPFKADRLVLVAERALETSRLKREVSELQAARAGDADDLVGTSPAINQLRQTIEKVAPTNSRILIVGPSGLRQGAGRAHASTACRRAPTGRSSSSTPPTITPERMEIELFGVEAGERHAARKVGALEEAHGGTLFIDEIADMPRETQNKILRVLVDQTFQRVGGTTKVAGRRAHHLVDRARPRGRDRRGPLPRGPLPPPVGGADPRAAARRAARGHSRAGRLLHGPDLAGDRPAQAHASATTRMAVLQSHDWPGNVRQLRNNVERLMILAGGDAGRGDHRRHAAAGGRLDGADACRTAMAASS